MKFLLLGLFLFASGVTFAQKAVQYDTSNIHARSFNAHSIQKLQQDKDFQYDRFKEPPKSIWERFWSWVWYNIDQLMQTKAGRTTVYTVLIILAVAVIVFFIIKVIGMTGGGLLARSAKNEIGYRVSEDNIHGISFDNEIEQATATGNFRLATRLLYLQSLKSLSDNGYIKWEINKTNSDYVAEVINKPWSAIFKTLTWKFEYSWYGEVNVNKIDFDKLQLQFRQFNNELK